MSRYEATVTGGGLHVFGCPMCGQADPHISYNGQTPVSRMGEAKVEYTDGAMEATCRRCGFRGPVPSIPEMLDESWGDT